MKKVLAILLTLVLTVSVCPLALFSLTAGAETARGCSVWKTTQAYDFNDSTGIAYKRYIKSVDYADGVVKFHNSTSGGSVWFAKDASYGTITNHETADASAKNEAYNNLLRLDAGGIYKVTFSYKFLAGTNRPQVELIFAPDVTATQDTSVPDIDLSKYVSCTDKDYTDVTVPSGQTELVEDTEWYTASFTFTVNSKSINLGIRPVAYNSGQICYAMIDDVLVENYDNDGAIASMGFNPDETTNSVALEVVTDPLNADETAVKLRAPNSNRYSYGVIGENGTYCLQDRHLYTVSFDVYNYIELEDEVTIGTFDVQLWRGAQNAGLTAGNKQVLSPRLVLENINEWQSFELTFLTDFSSNALYTYLLFTTYHDNVNAATNILVKNLSIVDHGGETSGYYTYIISNEEATITTADTSISGDVTIPSTLGGYPVTNIRENAFRNCTSLTSITVPDSVTSIGDYAFYGCSSLDSITIPDSVTSVGNAAFSDCKIASVYITDLKSWCEIDFIGNASNPLRVAGGLYLNGEKLSGDVVIPQGTTKIGNKAFLFLNEVTSVTIPNSVTSIGDYAFQNCTSLTSITVPDSVTSIGDYAFYNCSSLTSIIIPDSVTNLGDSPFSYCSNLENITVDENNTVYHSAGNCLIETAEKNLIAGCKTSVIPTDDSVTSIGDYAFYNCSSLTSIIIPDSVTSIGIYAFYNCSNLKTVYLDGNKNDWTSITVSYGNVALLNADIKYSHSMVSEGSIRPESGSGKEYRSAGVRYKSRLTKELHESATEIGFVAAPTSFLNDMTLAEYAETNGNVAITAKVKGEGMNDVIYAVSTDSNGKTYYDYQMVITGLTRENVTQNMLDTEISVAMYVVVNNEKIYTETMAYSFNYILSLMNQ